MKKTIPPDPQSSPQRVPIPPLNHQPGGAYTTSTTVKATYITSIAPPPRQPTSPQGLVKIDQHRQGTTTPTTAAVAMVAAMTTAAATTTTTAVTTRGIRA